MPCGVFCSWARWGWGLATGAVLYFLIERTHLLGFTPDPEAPGAEPVNEH